MAVVEKTIGSGKDHATIALWESNVGVYGTDIYKGIIQEDAAFDENVTLLGSTGTPSATSYLWLTTDPANRHAGIAGTGHGRMENTTAAAHCLTISQNWVRVDWLEIQQATSTGESAEGIRLGSGVSDVLISYNIIWSSIARSDQDGIYSASSGIDVAIDNCLIYGWNRAAIHHQANSVGDWSIDHCGLHSRGNDGTSGADKSGAVKMQDGDTGSTVVAYNTWGISEGIGDGNDRSWWDEGGTAVTWSGTHNAHWNALRFLGTDNMTNWQNMSDGWADVTKSTGSWLVLTETDIATFDGTLLDDAAGNLPAGNGTNRQGSEPDARQDFSVDITGSARPTTGVDQGAHQVSAAAGPTYQPMRRRATTLVGM